MLRANQFQSSNPVLANDDAFSQYYGEMAGEKADVTTLQGVVNKTTLLVLIAVACGAGGFALAPMVGSMGMLIAFVVTVLIAFGIYFKIYGDPKTAVYLAPPYAAIQGAALGMLTGLFEQWLASAGVNVMGGLAFQAFVITISIMLAMLGLYYTGLIKPTKTLFSVIATLTVGIMLTYLLSFVAILFGQTMPVIHVFSGVEGGWIAWAGLGFNVLVLGVASMWLIFDFKLIEDKVNQGAPRYMEWFCAFALIVTLLWIYIEAVKLAARLALLFAARE